MKTKIITTGGNAQVSTAQKVFGTGSLYLPRIIDYLEIVSSQTEPDFDFGSGDFTIECWFYATTGGGLIYMFKQGGYGAWGMQGVPAIAFVASTNGSSWIFSSSFATASLNTWYHTAFVRSGSNFYAYLGGTRYTLGTSASALMTPDCNVTIGADPNHLYGMIGYIDEIRVSKGIARYTAATITVPTSPFVADSNTVLLVHCDGANGSTVFTDSSAFIFSPFPSHYNT